LSCARHDTTQRTMTDTADAAQPSPEQEPPPSVRRHRGDIMSPETRSRVMSRIRGRDTGPELVVASGLAALGLPYESHARDLPGRPDFVLRNIKLAIFVDGDFWHGYRFADWRDKLSPAWELKIARNRDGTRATSAFFGHKGGKSAEKPLGGSRRFEPLQLAFAPSHHLMRIFCPIVFAEPLFVRTAQP
jgi:DNA mismatch endonuclease Vsr